MNSRRSDGARPVQLPPLPKVKGIELTRQDDLEHCYGFSERHGLVKENADEQGVSNGPEFTAYHLSVAAYANMLNDSTDTFALLLEISNQLAGTGEWSRVTELVRCKKSVRPLYAFSETLQLTYVPWNSPRL